VIYPKGSAEELNGMPPVAAGRGCILSEGDDITLLALGSMVKTARETAFLLKKKGFSARIINARFVKPLDGELIKDSVNKTVRLVTMEENCLQGGFGSAVLEFLTAGGIAAQTLCIGIPDRFVEQGSRTEVIKQLGLDAESITAAIMKRFWPE
jgi:1-deoxy-D-xylulose-5-phosphate synthase